MALQGSEGGMKTKPKVWLTEVWPQTPSPKLTSGLGFGSRGKLKSLWGIGCIPYPETNTEPTGFRVFLPFPKLTPAVLLRDLTGGDSV